MSSRAERVARAQELRARGLLLREIAAEMGTKVGTVHGWLADPDLSKQRARRDGYRGTCGTCGRQTDGSRGRDRAPDECIDCVRQRQHDERRWTRETVIAAIQRWADEHGGVPPAATDWNPTLARLRGRPERGSEYPSTPTVQGEFGGSWNGAISAAGFEPFEVGHYGREGEDSQIVGETIRLYRSGMSLAQVALAMGVSTGAIRHRLATAEEPRRTPWEWREVAA